MYAGTARVIVDPGAKRLIAVHDDVQALLNAGVIDRTGEGILFPYDAVHVDSC